MAYLDRTVSIQFNLRSQRRPIFTQNDAEDATVFHDLTHFAYWYKLLQRITGKAF